nr:hypothetical protein [Rhizobium leguminosarum]
MLSVEPRSRGENSSTMWVAREEEKAAPRCAFYHSTAMHYDDPVANLPSGSKIMRCEKHPDPLLRCNFPKQAKNLSLDGSIECSRGFVRYYDLRFREQSHRQHHPLTLPTRKLVRILEQDFAPTGKLNRVEHFECVIIPATPPASKPTRRLLRRDVFLKVRHLCTNSKERVETGVGILGYDRDRAATRSLGSERQLPGVDALKLYTSAGNFRLGLGKGAKDGAGESGLPASGLTDKPDDLTLIHLNVHLIQSLRVAALRSVDDGECTGA